MASAASAPISVTFPRKTSKSIPMFDIPSSLLVHPSKPCSFHDSVSGHDENAASSRVVSKIPSNIPLSLHSTCNCSCYRWAVKDGFPTFLQRTSSKHVQSVASQPTSLPILKNLTASAAIVGINFKMEWDSTIFPTCASRTNFRVRVCRFTSRMAVVACFSNWAFAQN